MWNKRRPVTINKRAAFLLVVILFSGFVTLYVVLNGDNAGHSEPEATFLHRPDIVLKRTPKVSKKVSRPYDIYITNGYLIKDSEIRIALLTMCHYFANLTLFTSTEDEGARGFPVSLEQIENCPSWIKQCVYSGQYGSVKIPNDMDLPAYVDGRKNFYIAYDDDLQNRTPIKLVDSRVQEDKTKKHKLAVCLFPIVLMPEWTILAQFFEQWISHGATKFYFVSQSFSKEFDSMLRIYERDPNISIERVNWSVWPVRKNVKPDDDPNRLTMRAEEVFAVNDCLHRARGHAEYVAVFDFDETIVVYKNSSLLDMLDDLYKAENKTAAFIFRSSYTRFENRWVNATNPKQLDFSIYNNVLLENKTWGVGSMSKTIVKPERIKTQIVHYVTAMENSEYKSHVLDPEVSKIYHLRLVKWMYAQENISTVDHALQKYTPRWAERYFKRLENEEERLKTAEKPSYLTLNDNTWGTRGVAIMRELEKCHLWLFSWSGKCPAHYRCIGNLTTIKPDEWIYVDQSWTVI